VRTSFDGVSGERTIRYAESADGDSIAYQVVGSGPIDLVFVPGFVSNVELYWNEPAIARFYERLASFSRLVLFDKRGTGLSDPLQGPQMLEERIEDVSAVLDAAHSERAALIGLSEGSAMAMVLAAARPERISHLVLCGVIVGGDADDHPAGSGWSSDARERAREALAGWGDGHTARLMAPSAPVSDRRLGALERAGASPRMARALVDMWLRLDVRDVLPSITVPTLVLHRTDELFPIAAARQVAARIPGARIVELPGRDHVPWFGDTDAYVAEIEEFLTGARGHERIDRVLATVLVTDIVSSTERAVAIGDASWRSLIERHDALVRMQLGRFGGREIKHTGDGFLASFDGPALAIRCALAIVAEGRDDLDLAIRAGVHTGEVDLVGGDIRGVAVHIAARVAALTAGGDVLVSSTVKELVTGSGIPLEPAGRQTLKGVPGEWELYRVAPTPRWVTAPIDGGGAGARTLAGSVFGLDAAPERRLGIMGLRAAATQYGYLLGASAGGVCHSADAAGRARPTAHGPPAPRPGRRRRDAPGRPAGRRDRRARSRRRRALEVAAALDRDPPARRRSAARATSGMRRPAAAAPTAVAWSPLLLGAHAERPPPGVAAGTQRSGLAKFGSTQ
jgi:pimeloyl-ACP methyl ester carboxylesterase